MREPQKKTTAQEAKAEAVPEKEAPAEEVTEQPPVDLAACKEKAEKVVEKYSKWSLATGLIPAPAIDLVALTAVQIKMVSEICKAFEQSFSEHKLKSVLVPLLGAAMPQALTTGGVSSTVKAIPVYGTLVGLSTMPLLSAGASYAIGSAFISHFANGGTLLSLNISSMKDAVKENVQKYKNKNKDDEDASVADEETAKA
ncbi:hypothetical protein VA7868_03012 [Vibrio aerogenes CECT 7868]|uniref:DUF697 domain-containing protein n=1 Tax=Vibrio aerogenes CECT 7868 TaxID=1216006 RepID=A0A1M5ZP98_9VIBR|nr:DUF697 domain-containing protein [Vibrio aerogenes]SHI26021.1 hypothetical protein VA7868_03012 [Vibrio aerogenes CECT 7868]